MFMLKSTHNREINSLQKLLRNSEDDVRNFIHENDELEKEIAELKSILDEKSLLLIYYLEKYGAVK